MSRLVSLDGKSVDDVIYEAKMQLHRIDTIVKMTYLGAYKEEDDGIDKTVGAIHLSDFANIMEVITTLSRHAYECIDLVDTRLGSEIRSLSMTKESA